MYTHAQAQAEGIKQSLGELGALNINIPSGRFMLNLSRSIDRLVALRLQVRQLASLASAKNTRGLLRYSTMV